MHKVIELELFSPRRGHTDTYTIELSKDSMTITMTAQTAKCIWEEDSGPKWIKQGLERILSNEHILYPPRLFEDLLVCLWKAWRNGDLDNQSVENEFKTLEDRVNISTKNRSNTTF